MYNSVVDIMMYIVLYLWDDEDTLFYLEVPKNDLDN